MSPRLVTQLSVVNPKHMYLLGSTPGFSRVFMGGGVFECVCVTIIIIEGGVVNSRVMWGTLERR